MILIISLGLKLIVVKKVQMDYTEFVLEREPDAVWEEEPRVEVVRLFLELWLLEWAC